MASSPPPRVFLVQRATALYSSYEDKFAEVIGVYSTLEDANAAVRGSRREFMAEFGIEEEEGEGEGEGGDFTGFVYEDRGSGESRKGNQRVPVGLYWEFEDGVCFYSCGVECWPVLGGK